MRVWSVSGGRVIPEGLGRGLFQADVALDLQPQHLYRQGGSRLRYPVVDKEARGQGEKALVVERLCGRRVTNGGLEKDCGDTDADQTDYRH